MLCSQNLVYDRARDAFDLCNAMTGHLPAGSNAQLYISNFLDGQLKNGFPFPAFCDQSHNSLPLYTNSPPSLDLTDESEFHPHLPLPTAARQSSSSSLPLLLLNALSSLAKEKQQEHIATSGSMSPRNTRSTSSDLLAQLPEAVTDEIGDKDDGGRGAQPPPLFAHQSRELAEAIQRAASAAQLPTREPMDLSMALAPSNGESMALAPSNSDSAAVGEELPLAYTDSAVAGAGTSSSAEPRSLHESAQHSPK